VKCLIWSIAVVLKFGHYGNLESFEILCWRRMEKISWTDHVRNEEVLLRVKEQRDIVHTVLIEGRLTGLVADCVGAVL